jgi:hypothetical protein
MATGGNSSENWQGPNRRRPRKDPWSDIRHELGGFTIAELASEGTWLLLAAVTTAVPDKIMDGATKTVGKYVVEPMLDPLEALVTKVCHLEECKIDKNESREVRAQHLARAMIVFTPAWAGSWAVKLLVRHELQPEAKRKEDKARKEDKVFSPSANMIITADEITQLGSMYVLNNQLAPASDEMIRSLTRISQKVLGVSEKRAHEFASTVVVWAVPNAIGMIGASAAIMGKHLYDWPKGWVGRMFGRKDNLPPPNLGK